MDYQYPVPIHPRLRAWVELSEVLAIAAETGARRVQAALRHRGRSGRARRPGADTPLWNVCASELRQSLQTHGAKVRLARYLGIPRQRVHNYLTNPTRLPDAEVALRMLHWMCEQRIGKDRSL
jgi:hypothetical protein